MERCLGISCFSTSELLNSLKYNPSPGGQTINLALREFLLGFFLSSATRWTFYISLKSPSLEKLWKDKQSSSVVFLRLQLTSLCVVSQRQYVYHYITKYWMKNHINYILHKLEGHSLLLSYWKLMVIWRKQCLHIFIEVLVIIKNVNKCRKMCLKNK